MNRLSIAGWMQKYPDGVREQVRRTIRLQEIVTDFCSDWGLISDMRVTKKKYTKGFYKSLLWECQCVKKGRRKRSIVLQMIVFPTECIAKFQNGCGLYLNVLVYANWELMGEQQILRLVSTMMRGGDDFNLFLTNLPTSERPVRFYPRIIESEGCSQVALCLEPTSPAAGGSTTTESPCDSRSSSTSSATQPAESQS